MITDKSTQRIKSLDGLKAIAMLLIFYWHSSLPKPDIDLGARCCEFFFVVSGFLTGYKYFSTDFPSSFKDFFKYYSKKLSSLWPLHIFCLLFDILITMNIPQSFNDIKILLTNLFLLQSWSNDSAVFFSFNGVSWFLSSIMFCYLISPLLLILLRKAKRVWRSLAMLTALFIIRLLWEYLTISNRLPFNVNFHVFPVVRLLEFGIGMTLIPTFIYLKNKSLMNSKTFLTILEIISSLSTALLCILGKDLMRGVFAIAFCLPVFIFAFNKGLISDLMSLKPFEKFSKIQMEFFMFHQDVLYLVSFYLLLITKNDYILTLLSFILTVGISICYKFLSKRDSLFIKINQKINNL